MALSTDKALNPVNLKWKRKMRHGKNKRKYLINLPNTGIPYPSKRPHSAGSPQAVRRHAFGSLLSLQIPAAGDVQPVRNLSKTYPKTIEVVIFFRAKSLPVFLFPSKYDPYMFRGLWINKKLKYIRNCFYLKNALR